MDEQLYFIENEGCDDTTKGVARISDEDFPKFKEIIENLNKNSTYGCMPTIKVYKIDMNDLQEVEYDPKVRFCDAGYSDDDFLFFDDKTYILARKHRYDYRTLECVIGDGD